MPDTFYTNDDTLRSTYLSPPAQYYLGVDGGGSKTLAIIVDEQGHELGRGLAGSANYAADGLETALTNIRLAVQQATQAANITQVPSLHKAWLGLAGLDRPADFTCLTPHLSTLASSVHLTNDAELALGALPATIGIALIAGTGSIALGRDVHGRTARTGGWGHLLGDEGSGYDLGRLALLASVRAADGRGQPTLLLEMLMQHWQLDSPDDIIGEIYTAQNKTTIAQVAPYVFKAASLADEVASRIIQQAAEELALAVLTVSTKLDFAHQAAVSLALGGSLLLRQPDLSTLVLQNIRYQLAIDQVVYITEPALSAARAIIALT